MSIDLNLIKEDLIAASDAGKEFVGAFFYEPMGIESSALLNTVTLYALLGAVAMIAYRIAKPAPHPRYRKPIEYDFGRNT